MGLRALDTAQLERLREKGREEAMDLNLGSWRYEEQHVGPWYSIAARLMVLGTIAEG